jgi:hypothetical protein
VRRDTWQSLQAICERQLRQFFIEHHYRRRRSTERIIERIRRYNQLVGGEVQQVPSEEARMVAQILLLLNARLRQLEARMKQIMASHRLGAVFCSIPGAGKVLAGKLMALLGDNKSRFAKAAELQPPCLISLSARCVTVHGPGPITTASGRRVKHTRFRCELFRINGSRFYFRCGSSNSAMTSGDACR